MSYRLGYSSVVEHVLSIHWTINLITALHKSTGFHIITKPGRTWNRRIWNVYEENQKFKTTTGSTGKFQVSLGCRRPVQTKQGDVTFNCLRHLNHAWFKNKLERRTSWLRGRRRKHFECLFLKLLSTADLGALQDALPARSVYCCALCSHEFPWCL